MTEKDFVKIPIQDAITPPVNGGFINMMVNRYWGVTDDDCILMWKGHSPQCNTDEEIAKQVCGNENHPATSVKFLETVYLSHNCHDYV